VSIFRHAIFGSGLLVVLDTFVVFPKFRETAILGMYIFGSVFLAGVTHGNLQKMTWQFGEALG